MVVSSIIRIKAASPTHSKVVLTLSLNRSNLFRIAISATLDRACSCKPVRPEIDRLLSFCCPPSSDVAAAHRGRCGKTPSRPDFKLPGMRVVNALPEDLWSI